MLRACLPSSLLVLLACCNSSIPSRAVPQSDAAPSEEDPDAGQLPPGQVQLRISPGLGLMGAGDSMSLHATLVDAEGQEMDVTSAALWSVSDTSLAAIDSTGTMSALSAGPVDVFATVDNRQTSVPVEIFGDLRACCDVAASQSAANFCSISPGNAACPMTLPGQACDPDGDGDYDEIGPELMAEMGAFFGAQCSEPACTIDEVPNVATDCTADYDPENRSWRCVVLTTDFPGLQASQVCKDLGSGPRWYTYNLSPAECCACDGLSLPLGQIPPTCECAGGGCF